MKAVRFVWLTIRYVVVVAVLVVFLFPLYWLIVTALKTPEEILSYPPVWWPRTPRLASFSGLLANGDAVSIINSLAVSLGATVLAVVFGTAAAVVSLRARLGAGLFASWALASRMAPPVLIAFPFFMLFAGIGRTGSLAVLTLLLAALNLPYVLWMMRGYLREVPVALQEMALVAGLDHGEVLTQVAWPLVRGGLVATSAFAFVLAWNELIFALMLTTGAAETLPARLAGYGAEPEAWASAAALCVVGMLPALIAVALMHRRLARSLSFGVVRG